MQLEQTLQNVFGQLSESLQLLSPDQYTKAIPTLSNASIGQHVRHIIEMFQCLEAGYETGVVNYEKRKRDPLIETNKDLAIELLQAIYKNLNRENKELILEAAYDETNDKVARVNSNYQREIIYNLEHTVHHMALVKIGIREVSNLSLPEGYGVASSTIKFRQTCAQ
jgi:hypothetical protein